MVVQCAKCQTKFRFDGTLIEGEGVWVRCSRCRNVFFLENKPADKAEIRSETVGTFEKMPDDDNTKAEEPQAQGDIYSRAQPLPYERLSEDIKRDAEIASTRGDSGKDHSSHDDLIDKIEKDTTDSYEDDVKEQTGKSDAKDKAGGTRRKQLIYLLLIVLAGWIYFLFTDTGEQARNMASSSISSLVDKVAGRNQKAEEVGPAQVELSELRQYFVSNAATDNIRVVEGVAVNKSLSSMTRIRVKAGLYGEGNLIMEKESYCGNLLSNDELISMMESDIQKELSNPSGSDVSNDRVISGGRIPFMIVFVNEPPGGVKVFVVPSGAERLLP